MPDYNSGMKYTKYVPTPIIRDTAELLKYKKGQWVRLAGSTNPSRFHSVNKNGIVLAFHYPNAGKRFNTYTRAEKPFQMKLEY